MKEIKSQSKLSVKLSAPNNNYKGRRVSFKNFDNFSSESPHITNS